MRAIADEVLAALCKAARDGYPDHDFLLPGQTVQESCIAGKESHEERAAAPSAISLEPRRQVGVESQADARTAISLNGRASVREREHRHGAGELTLPVSFHPLEVFKVDGRGQLAQVFAELLWLRQLKALLLKS